MSIANKLSYMSAQAEDLTIIHMILKRQNELAKTVFKNDDKMETAAALLAYDVFREMLSIVQHRLDFNKAMAAEEDEEE